MAKKVFGTDGYYLSVFLWLGALSYDTNACVSFDFCNWISFQDSCEKFKYKLFQKFSFLRKYQ